MKGRPDIQKNRCENNTKHRTDPLSSQRGYPTNYPEPPGFGNTQSYNYRPRNFGGIIEILWQVIDRPHNIEETHSEKASNPNTVSLSVGGGI